MQTRIIAAFLAASGPALFGAGDTSSPDPDLPEPLDPNVAAPLIEKSPFTRALDLGEKLQLTGIAYVQGKPVATLVDRETKQNYLVSEVPNAQGWKLAGASTSAALKMTSVQLQVGSEVVTIHYGDSQLAPSSSGPGGRVGPSVWPSEQEVIRTDENGKQYVRGSAYLSDADRDRYYRGWSREAHDKFREVIRDNRDMMFKASPQQRAEFSKKVFDKIDSEEKARGNTSTGAGGPGYSGRPSFGGPPPSGGGGGPR